MAKHGIGSILPFLAAPAALLTGGLLAPALFGGEAAAAGAGAGALGAGAEGAATALPAAAGLGTDAGLAAAVNAAPITAGLGETATALGATPLSAGLADAAATAAGPSSFLIPGTDTPLTAGAGEVFSATPNFAGLPAANTLGGTPLPLSAGNLLDVTGGVSSLNALSADAPAVAGSAAAPTDFLVPGTDTPLTAGQGEVFSGAPNFGGSVGSGGADEFMSDTWDFIKKNPGLIASVGGLGLEAIRGQQPIPGANQLTQNAALAQGAATTAEQRAQAALANQGQFLAQSTQNLNAPNTGQLPPGELAAINNAANAAKTQIRSQFAAMGIPGGSTMERQQVAQVDQQVAQQRLDAAQKLATLGVNEAQLAQGQGSLAAQQAQLGLEGEGLAARDLTTLMNAQILRDQAMQNALARFAAAAAGPATARVPPRFDTTQETA